MTGCLNPRLLFALYPDFSRTKRTEVHACTPVQAQQLVLPESSNKLFDLISSESIAHTLNSRPHRKIENRGHLTVLDGFVLPISQSLQHEAR